MHFGDWNSGGRKGKLCYTSVEKHRGRIEIQDSSSRILCALEPALIEPSLFTSIEFGAHRSTSGAKKIVLWQSIIVSEESSKNSMSQ